MSEPNTLKRAVDAPAVKEEGWWETIKVIVQALIIALVVRTLLFQPFNIPSGSLIPTLLVGDYLFVSKYSYGYSHYSLPGFLDLAPAAMPGRLFASQPKRGDIIVFKLPRDGETDYIKRLIGLPGDKIQMIKDRLYINGQIVEREPLPPYRRAGVSATSRRFPITSKRCRAASSTRSSSSTATQSDALHANTDVYRSARAIISSWATIATIPATRACRRTRAASATCRSTISIGRAEVIFFSVDEARRRGNSGAGRGRCAGTACSMRVH